MSYIDAAGPHATVHHLARAHQAHDLLKLYANPLRQGMPLSSTEQEAVRRAAKLLRLEIKR